MADCMTFPKTIDEFMEEYKIVDSEQIYTNGIELVPIFRMKQWFEHLSEDIQSDLQQTSDCISRQATINIINKNRDSVFHDSVHYEDVVYDISNLPYAQSEKETCKDCKWEDSFGYGECHHCKRRFEDMWEAKDNE